MKDDKFRVFLYFLEENRFIMVNLYILKEVKIVYNFNLKVKREDVFKKLKEKKYLEVLIIIEFEDIRGVMERCFMSFFFFERNFRIILKNKYEIDIYYYIFEEDEVVRKIMFLGLYVKVKLFGRVREIVIDKIKKVFMFEII